MPAQDIQAALDIGTEVIACDAAQERRLRRALARKDVPPDWDVLVLEHGAQAADGPPLELHRAFVGVTGEFRAGPVVPEFEALYDRLAHDQALVLPLCAPRALYAVNKHVRFRPYRTTFELADTSVGKEHWSWRHRTEVM